MLPGEKIEKGSDSDETANLFEPSDHEEADAPGIDDLPPPVAPLVEPDLPPRPEHDITAWLPGGIGRIVFHASSNKFEAICDKCTHGKCRKFRTCAEASGGRVVHHPSQGRHLAELVEWLRSAHQFDSQAAHNR